MRESRKMWRENRRDRLKDRIVDVKEGATPAPRQNNSPSSSRAGSKGGPPRSRPAGWPWIDGLQHRARGLPGLSQLDFAVDLVGEADAAERHRRAGGEGLIALEPALHKGLADRLFDLALGGHAERLEKLPNADVEDVFVHGHLLCACPSGHDAPVLACPVVYPLRPPSPALARVGAGWRPFSAISTSKPSNNPNRVDVVVVVLVVQNSCHEETPGTF